MSQSANGPSASDSAPVRRDAGTHGTVLQMDAQARARFRWDIALVWFMRLTAVAWIAKGIAYWAALLGFLPQLPVFEQQGLQWQSAVVYFAVIDLVAAVGLWLTSTWGGVMWLLAAMSYFLIAVLVPHAVVSAPPVLAGLVALVAVYFLLSWLASRIEP